jgi:hypothetical protein
MSTLLRYMISTDYTRFRDLQMLETRADGAAAATRGIDAQIQQLSATVIELAATVRVLTRALADAKLLDLATIEKAITAEIHQPHDAKGARIPANCVRCNKGGFVDDMVKVGADVWCHDCARNP